MPEHRTYYEVIRDCVTESTAHGITYVFKREQIGIKLAWLICTLASTGVCGWLVSKSISDYYSYETVTKSETIYEMPAIFPTISICSQNMFTTQAGYDFVANMVWENNLLSNEEWLSMTLFEDNDFYKYGLGVRLLNSDKYSDDFRKSMGYSINEMLLLCYFNNYQCSSNDFYWYFDPYYG